MVKVINKDLLSINKWLKANKIKINVSKNKYIIFSYRKQFLLPNIQHDAENIEVTDSLKFLGIVLDGRLKFKNHEGVMSKESQNQ